MRVAWTVVAVAGCSFTPDNQSPVAIDAPAGVEHHDAQLDAPPDHDASLDAGLDGPVHRVCSTTYDVDDHNGHLYRRTTVTGTWQDAEADCASDGNHLTKIETADEDDFITSHIVEPFVWIGLYDPTMTATYIWSDNTPLGTYTNFSASSPTSETYCVDKSSSSGTWSPWFCDPVAANEDPQVGICECDQ